MRAALCLLFTVVLASAQAKKGTFGEFMSTMSLSQSHMDDCYDALDVHKNGVINMDDMHIHYYHEEAAFAKEKFLEIVNLDTVKDISKDELNTFLSKPVVTQAVFECTYVKSTALRKFCFSDQVLSYIYLRLDNPATTKFFKSIAGSDDKITIEDVKKMQPLSKQFTLKEVANFLEEIGGEDGVIDEIEFENYVHQEDLGDDFRECRTKLVGCKAEYNNECLKLKLINWSMNKLTERDSVQLFELLENDDDNDLVITVEDIQKVSGCNDVIAAKFVKLMDKSGDGKVTYAEYRTYLRAPLVRLHLERDCARKIEDQSQEVDCYKKELMKRVDEMHTPIWMRTPDLDKIFTFEHMDTSDNGKINCQEDLIKGLGWSEGIAKKFVFEMDGPDDDKDVSLDEFNEHSNLPHLVYATADCMSNGKNINRIKCNVDELLDLFTVMLTGKQVTDFFKHYDKDNNRRITRAEVEAVGLTGKVLENFLNEIGMGDDTINYDEFNWYVRQQDVSHLYIEKECTGPPEWHTTLVYYTENAFTQYDSQMLFRALDTNKNFELSCDEVGAAPEDFKAILKMFESNDETFNYLEYWLYLWTPKIPRKTHLEKQCTKKFETQEQEIDCYTKELKNVGK